MTPQKLLEYRRKSGLSQDEIGTLLKVSHSAVNRWENGQEIPGPADLLLDWMIEGKVPFQGTMVGGKLVLPPEVAESTLDVHATLRTWQEIQARSGACGFEDPTDWIASLILKDLSGPASEGTRTGEHAPVDEVALVAEEAATPGGGGDVDGALKNAAEAFQAEHPLPAEGVGGSGSTSPVRKDVSYTPKRGRPGISKGKR